MFLQEKTLRGMETATPVFTQDALFRNLPSRSVRRSNLWRSDRYCTGGYNCPVFW